MLAAVLKEEGCEVHTIINTLMKPISNDDFIREALEIKPDFVGISMMTMEVLKVYALIRLLKAYGFFVIVGGAHATSCHEEVVRYGADIAVRNEGEDTIREIVRGVKRQDILGITYRSWGELCINKPRPRARDMSRIPLPDFSVFDLDHFRRTDDLIGGLFRVYTSRGCPGKCTFCDWQVFGQKVVYHPISSVMEDIKRRIDTYGITTFLIADDCFTTNKRHVEEFCREIVKIKPTVSWQTSARADHATPELMQMMADAGCFLVGFGTESGDPETLQRINKRVSVEENVKGVHYAAAAGMQTCTNLMFGFPWETTQSLDNTLKFIYDVWDDTYMFNVAGALIPFPGTEIYNEFVDIGNFRDYWLNLRYQDCGVQLYQNSITPYAVSTFYQRNMYDDTYIQEEYFFKYSDEYKKRLSEVVAEVGRHNIGSFYRHNPVKRCLIYNGALLSRAMYRQFPRLEKGIGAWIPAKKRPHAEDTRNRNKGLVKHKGAT
uniref:Putative radical SAM superfamily protein n=1 Tax=viral metagenome TaxID=1070528 RepID=A0A6M3IU53_9ZZZZ